MVFKGNNNVVGDPIQVFLECLVRQVERENGESEEGKEEWLLEASSE